MASDILDVEAFYAGVASYMERVDPTWDEERSKECYRQEQVALSAILGPANGRSVLDCSCGPGTQAIPLARLGWRVTGTDATEASLRIAEERAREEGVTIDLRSLDMRDLGKRFHGAFDWVISCMALDNLGSDSAIQEALRGMHEALKPGGRCYMRLRNFDDLLRFKPRYEFKEERVVPHGRVIHLDDWEYESDTHLVHAIVFLREDRRRQDYSWTSDVFRLRRRILRKADLERALMAAGFEDVEFVPPRPWHPHLVVASKGISAL